MADNIKFTPIRGTQENIDALPIVNGHVYFATDTGRIFMDTVEGRILLGNNGVAVFYANDPSPVEITDAPEAGAIFSLVKTRIENIEICNVNDLILNKANGCFYQVLTINADTVRCLQLAVSGSGGGGGGGGGSISERDVDITWDTATIATGNTYVYGQDYNAVFIPTTSAVGDSDCTVTFNILDKVNNTTTSITQTGRSNERMNFNMAQLPQSTNITLQVVVTSDNSQYNNGLGYQRNITNLKVVSMAIEKPSADTYLPLVKADDASGTLTLSYMPKGQKDDGGNAIVDLVCHAYVDGNELISETFPQTVPASYYGRVVTVAIPRQSHGVHEITFKLSTRVNGTDIYTNAISYEGAWASTGVDTPIIWIGKHDTTVVNYENSYIYYMVFDPQNYANGLAADIYLYKENAVVSQISAPYSDDGWLVWDISNIYEANVNSDVDRPNHFSISCRGAKADITVNVTTKGARDLGLTDTNTLLVNMTTAGRSSSEIKSQRDIFQSTAHTSEVTATLTNFNWQNNGWKDSEGTVNGVDSGSYLSIANGAGLTVTMASGLSLNQAKDYTFEMRFRVRNVQEYSTLIKVVPKYFYQYPNPEEGHEGEWLDAYTITLVNDEEVAIAKPGFSSLYEWEIDQAGYRIGVDKYGNLLMDEENTVKEEDTSSGVVVRWLNQSGYGFCIGTQEAFFKTPSGIANVRYCEDEVINISMVASKTDKLCYIYLNGILSGAVAMPTGDGSTFIINSPITFNSQYCDFDLYRFRIYEKGLTMPQVIHNYLSDMHSTKLFDQNQITDPLDPTALSYTELVSYNSKHPTELSMPYATWQITDGENELLPYKKGNSRVVTVEFVNPTLDKALADGLISEWTYYTHCPSFTATGVNIDVQGTSSQKYPRRNYKTKFKDAKNNWVYTQGSLAGQPLTADYTVTDSNGVEHTLVSKFHMDVESYGVNKFTWKIDYMESSESYNSGFANLMGNKVHPLYSKHPLEDYNLNLGDLNTDELRTCVYGFPVLTFHKYANGDYEYIGKYVMNEDKSANEAFGYELKVTQPYVSQRTKRVKNEETGEFEDKTYQPTVKEIAECWELRDNQGTWCSFKYPDSAARASGFMTKKEGTDKLEIIDHYEYRYSFYADELDAAYDYNSFTDANTQVTYSNAGQINTYLQEKYANLERLFNWLDSTDTNTATNDALAEAVTYSVDSQVTGDLAYGIDYELVSEGLWNATFHNDTKEYRRQKFRAELEDHLDKEYCLTYFVLTELLLCYDSRGKNMMLSTYGPQKVGGDYIWYPCFYDIDTQLGLNNSGAYLWDYDADVTKDNLFSTPTSVLWVNLYDLFYNDIVQKYRVLRGVANPSNDADRKINGSLTQDNIVGAYEFTASVFGSYAMQGVRPIIAVGLDEYYKYMAPALTAADFAAGKLYAGYYDTTGTHKYQATPTYAYCAQGDKKLTTELLIRNRLNYIDSWWLGGDYRAGVVENQIFIRANANHSSTSDLFLDDALLDEIPAAGQGKGFTLQNYPVEHFDARPGAKIKPFLHQYVSYFMDNIPSVPVKYDGRTGQEDGVWTNVDSAKLVAFKTEPDLSQQITYIPGGDYISSLGDISLMYPNSLQIFHGQRLLDLRIGSDSHGYSNPLLTSSSDWELDAMPLLKTVNMSNLTQFKRELIFTESKKLQEFRALGSPLERVIFAPGAPLTTIHLPSTITTLSLSQNKNLTTILTSKPQDAETQNFLNTTGLYIEGVTDYNVANANTGHKLSTYSIEGGALGYNSYTMLKNLVALKQGAATQNMLAINLKDVHWTPYTVVESGEPYDENTTYYLATDHSTYTTYTYVDVATWATDTLNGVVFTKDDLVDTSVVSDLQLLSAFIGLYVAAHNGNYMNQFTNTTGASTATMPTITGDVFVENTNGTAVNEEDLTNVFKVYYPNLTIRAANVNTANITKYVQVLDNGKTEVIEMLRSSSDTPLMPTAAIPMKANFDFCGWSTTPGDSEHLFLEYANNAYGAMSSYSFAANNTDILTLYAVFVPHKYSVIIYDGDDSILQLGAEKLYDADHNEITKLVTVGTAIGEITKMPYKAAASDDFLGCYAFVGYMLHGGNGETVDLENYIVNRDVQFDAKFTYNANIRNVDFSSLFDVQETAYIDSQRITVTGAANSNMNVNSGWELFPKDPDSLRGKIVIPTQFTKNGVTKDVISLAGFHATGVTNASVSSNSQLTHVFMQDPAGTNLRMIKQLCFASCNNLVYFDFPDSSLRAIEAYAFKKCALMPAPGSSTVSLGSSVGFVGMYAFNAGIGNDTLPSISLDIGYSIAVLEQGAFNYLSLSGSTLLIGDANNPAPLAFNQPYTNVNTLSPNQANQWFAMNASSRWAAIYAYFQANEQNHHIRKDMTGFVYANVASDQDGMLMTTAQLVTYIFGADSSTQGEFVLGQGTGNQTSYPLPIV